MISEELVQEKSALIVELEAVKAAKGNRRKVISLASQAATLEAEIARLYLLSGDQGNAAISFISMGSCLVDANRALEARKAYDKALSLAPAAETRAWIQSQRESLPEVQTSVFAAISAHIEGNRQLRTPQLAAYSAAKSYFGSQRGHVIVQLPVGCGKTGTMAILPFGIANGRALVVAPNREIRMNAFRNFNYADEENFWRKTGVIANGHWPRCSVLDSDANVDDCDQADIVVTNIQQLVAGAREKWLSKFPYDYFDLIMIDEAHHNVAPTWKEAIDRFPDAKIASFTATPLRSDGQVVEGTRIYRFPIADAIKEGYVKDIASRRLEPSEIVFTYRDESRVHTLEEIMQLREETWFSRGVALSEECNRSIVDASIQCVRELRDGGEERHQIIAAACSIDHARRIRSLYAERGYNADVLHSDLPGDEQEAVRSRLRQGLLDVVVQIQMLGEGADYPQLSVAALFRPYRHLVPYVQFVGRVMRVLKQDQPGHPDNRGFIVSHVGLNVDRWWEELRRLDEDDQKFFEEVANGAREFALPDRENGTNGTGRRRFTPEMRVIEETIRQFIEERFLPEDSAALIDDLIQAMKLRGIDPEVLGISREELEKKLLESSEEVRKRGRHQSMPVQPQKARQEARRRLDERVRSGAKQLLSELGYVTAGFNLPRQFPGLGATNNLAAAIILINREIQPFLGVGPDERDVLTAEQLKLAHDSMDEIIDRVASKVRSGKEKGET